jgi:hypothetical protein
LAIRRSLASITRALARLGPALQAAAHKPASQGRTGRTGRKLKLSRARRATLKLQGQYIGYIRSLKPRQKTRVKALRAAKGVQPAIRLARRLAQAAAD